MKNLKDILSIWRNQEHGSLNETVIEVDFSPIVNARDEIEKVLVAMRNITQRRMFETMDQKRQEELILISELLYAGEEHALQLFAEIRTIAARCSHKPGDFHPSGEKFIKLFNNSLDHGIETPEQRLKGHKSVEGNIKVSFKEVDGRLRMAYSDDGQGLNLSMLKRIGVARGLLDQRCEDPAEICRLIFKEDFTTASAVTQTSGRGIGLSAVREYLISQGAQINTVIEPAEITDDFVPFKLQIWLDGKFFKKAS